MKAVLNKIGLPGHNILATGMSIKGPMETTGLALSPPVPFLPTPGLPTMTWDHWKALFRTYIEATDLVSSKETRQTPHDIAWEVKVNVKLP